MEQILAHPFLSGKKATRMLGESAQFDVFLSYRKQSDENTAQLLYDKLTAAGLKVWWDKKSLLPGVPWQVEIIELPLVVSIVCNCIVLKCRRVFAMAWSRARCFFQFFLAKLSIALVLRNRTSVSCLARPFATMSFWNIALPWS